MPRTLTDKEFNQDRLISLLDDIISTVTSLKAYIKYFQNEEVEYITDVNADFKELLSWLERDLREDR